MRRFNPARSILAGMDPAALQTRLTAMQTAYLDLSSGAKGQNYSYTQGDGTKAVTYTQANLPDLVRAIQLVQAQLGLVEPGRAFSISFGGRP